MSTEIQEAIRRSLQTEKNAMNFYQLGAHYLKDPDAKRIFEKLAEEEREHAEHFFKCYTGDDIPSFEAFMAAEPDNASSWVASLAKVIDGSFTEKSALELAMDKELKLEAALREIAGRFDDPAVRDVFERNARETHNHYILIESEYARLMGMVHESDLDTFVRE